MQTAVKPKSSFQIEVIRQKRSPVLKVKINCELLVK